MNNLYQQIQNQKDTVIYLQENLVSIPALGPENGGQGEKLKAEFLKSYLDKLGDLHIKELPATDQRIECGYRPNLAAKILGKNQNKTLWIVSHLDVVPAGDRKLWHTEPFTLIQKDSLIYGRGVEDNHHGLVASLLVAQALLNTNTTPNINLGLLFVADEETGNKYGLDFVLKEHQNLFGAEDEFLVPDFGTSNSTMVEIAEKNLMWLKLTVLGKQCHASTPDKGINSLLASSALVLKLRQLYELFPTQNSLFQPPYSTFEATKKEANVPNINTIPGTDIFYLDCRVLPEYNLQIVLDSIQHIREEITKNYGTKIEIDIIHQESSPSTDPQNNFVNKVINVIKQIYNVEAQPQGIGGGTVASYLRKKNYPAVVWATLLGTAHQPNEHTSIHNIIQDAKVIATLLF